jgi:hypothetical protein
VQNILGNKKVGGADSKSATPGPSPRTSQKKKQSQNKNKQVWQQRKVHAFEI